MSDYVKFIKMVIADIEQAFIDNKISNVGSLIDEYQRGVMELIQAEGPWGIWDTAISLKPLAKKLLSRVDENNVPVIFRGHQPIKAFIYAMPITVNMAADMIRIKGVPAEMLIDKLTRSSHSYVMDSYLVVLCSMAAKTSSVAANMLFADILSGKLKYKIEPYKHEVDIKHFTNFISLIPELDHVAPGLRDKLHEADYHFANLFNKHSETPPTFGFKTLAALKKIGCHEITKVVHRVATDFYNPEDGCIEYIQAGCEIPEYYYSDMPVRGISMLYCNYLMKGDERFVECLKQTRFNTLDKAALFRKLGDVIKDFKAHDINLEEVQIIQLLEHLAKGYGNTDVLQGATLASGINEQLLAKAPSLSQFKHLYLESGLGL